eukprot:UN01480
MTHHSFLLTTRIDYRLMVDKQNKSYNYFNLFNKHFLLIIFITTVLMYKFLQLLSSHRYFLLNPLFHYMLH